MSTLAFIFLYILGMLFFIPTFILINNKTKWFTSNDVYNTNGKEILQLILILLIILWPITTICIPIVILISKFIKFLKQYLPNK